MKYNFAVIVPLANEQDDFHPFIETFVAVLDLLESGRVYLIVDNVSKDKTLQCLSQKEDSSTAIYFLLS